MRTRVRVVQTQLEFPPPFAGRMRVKSPAVTQLALPFGRLRTKRPAAASATDDVVAVSEPSRWSLDLGAAHRGEMKFDELLRRHFGLVRTMVRPWLSRCPSANVGPEDLVQEALVEIWIGVSNWDRQYGVPIQSYVRMRVNDKLHSFTDKLLKRHAKYPSFLAQQIIEEKVIIVPSRSSDEMAAKFVTVTVPDEASEAPLNVGRAAAFVVGGLPSKQARVVAGLLLGEETESVTQLVYGSKCKRPRKAALRAFAAATALVHSSSRGVLPNDAAQRTKEDAQSNESSAEEVVETTCRRGFRKAQVDSSAHLGEGS